MTRVGSRRPSRPPGDQLLMIPDLDRVVDPGYVSGLAEKSTDDLRAMRAECSDLENGVSYVRRLAQGRLDLMVAELGRRDSGSGGDAAGLVAQLADLLSEGGARAAGSGRLTGDLEPPEEVVGPLTDRLDAAVGPGAISGVTELDDVGLTAGVAVLRDFESRLSEARRGVHSTVDAINEELAQRYRSGESPTND